MLTMFLIGLGPGEIIVIVIVAFIVLVIFGPKNLPKLGNSLGKGIKGLRKGLSGEDDNKNNDKSDINDNDDEIIVDEVADSGASENNNNYKSDNNAECFKKTQKKVVRRKSK